MFTRPRLPRLNSTVLTACAAAGVVTFAVMLLVSKTTTVSLTFGLVAAYLPFALAKARAARIQRERLDVWPAAVDDLGSAVRAGMGLPEAVGALGSRGPEALRPAFEQFRHDYERTGRFNDCLDRLASRLDDPVGDRVIEGLRIAREVGSGDLGRLLRNLSMYLRDEARTRAELEARQSWAVNGARLACAAPWVVLLFLSFQPGVIHRYQSSAGAAILVFAGLACLLAYRVMMRIGRLPREQRILGGASR